MSNEIARRSSIRPSKDRSVRALMALVDELTVGRDGPSLLTSGIERLVEALGIDGGMAFLTDPNRQLTTAAEKGVLPEEMTAACEFATRTLAEGAPSVSARPGGGHWMTAPLSSDGPLLGVLVLLDRDAENQPLSIEMLAAIGKHIGTGVANARLHAELRASSARTEILSRITVALASSMEMRDLIPSLGCEMASFVQFDRLALGFVNESGDYIEVVGQPAGTTWGLGSAVPVVGSGPGSVVLNGRPVLQEDLLHSHRFIEDMRLLEEGIRSYVLLPLNARGRAIGMLALGSAERRAYGAETVARLQPLADSISLVLDNVRLFQKTRELSITDEVTPLYNVRYFHQMLDRELKFAERYGSTLSLIFLDLDRFKPVNDEYGHLRGSRILREVGFLLRFAVRETDYPARYGGDEFVVILPQTDRRSALRLADKLRTIIEEHTFLQEEGINVTLGASLGVATFPNEAKSKEALIRLADERMYQDKETRNPGGR